MIKIKVTYLDYGIIKAKIYHINNWYDLYNSFNMFGIYDENSILKIEKVLDSTEENTTDLTQ